MAPGSSTISPKARMKSLLPVSRIHCWGPETDGAHGLPRLPCERSLRPEESSSTPRISPIYGTCPCDIQQFLLTYLPSDFSFTSSHRYEGTSLQVAVTTNGQGCRLGGRIRRDIVAKLPKEVGEAVQKVGQLRALAKRKAAEGTEVEEEHDASTPNRPVPSRSNTETSLETTRRHMKWVAQVSEYWPLQRLASMTPADMQDVLDGEDARNASPDTVPSQHALQLSPLALPPRGRIFLVGSGPGHPSMLTFATHAALTKHAQLVLSDKLVPAAVLDIIPPGVEIRIARKFPGNAEASQNEMMEAAVEAARRGLTVVRVSRVFLSLYRLRS